MVKGRRAIRCPNYGKVVLYCTEGSDVAIYCRTCNAIYSVKLNGDKVSIKELNLSYL